MSASHIPSYTFKQIDLYRAVLYRDAVRSGVNVQDKKALALSTMMAAGVNGKSALLDRIASGKPVFVIPPPVAMSYPWYGVIDNEPDQAIDLWMDAPSGFELMKQAEQFFQSIDRAMDKVDAAHHQTPPSGESSRQKTLRLTRQSGRPTVLLEQSHWQVISISKDGLMLHVTQPQWAEHGYVWSLTLEAVPASECGTVMVCHHDRSIKRITTIEQLRKETRWHVLNRAQELELACDEAKVAQAMDEARAKDREQGLAHGFASRFNEMTTQSVLQTRAQEIKDRLARGLPATLTTEEIEQTVQERIAKFMNPAERVGAGWYSVRADGALMHHGWRIRRVSPKTPPPEIILDLSILPPAPADFLAGWRVAASDFPGRTETAQAAQTTP